MSDSAFFVEDSRDNVETRFFRSFLGEIVVKHYGQGHKRQTEKRAADNK